MMPKNMMEYLVAIIALVALGLSIAAIAKKCKDNFAAPGTCMNTKDFGRPPSSCGVPCDTDDDYQYCFNTYGCEECVANSGGGSGGGSPLCNKSIGDSCYDSDKDELVFCNPPKTCLITPENEHNKIGKVVSLQDHSHAGGWTDCGGSGSGCFALSTKDSHGKILTHGGCCKNGNYECVGQGESNKPPFYCQQIV